MISGSADRDAASALLRRWRVALHGVSSSMKTNKSHLHGLRYWWFNLLSGGEPYRPSFLSASEAVALLAAMWRVDAPLCAELGGMAGPQHAIWRNASGLRGVPGEQIEIGLRLHVMSLDVLGPLSERVFGVQAPSSAFIEDYALLKEKPSCGVDGDGVRQKPVTQGIPLCLHLGVRDTDPHQQAYALRQVLQLVIAQQALRAQVAVETKGSEAQTASRFRIVEVRFSLSFSSGTSINGEALQYLAQLCERGIRIRDLPSVRDADDSPSSRSSIAASLQSLISPVQNPSVEQFRPRHVYISEHTSPHILPMICSAIQTSASVKHVHVEAKFLEPSELTPQQADARRMMWRWATYALFSRHAQHNQVQRLDIDCNFLSDDGIDSVVDVLAADNPLNAIFQTSSSRQQDSGWLSASKFYASPPSPSGLSSVHEANTSIAVRTIDSVVQFGEKFWRVLLPGFGDVWVADRDAQALEPHGPLSATTGHEVFHLRFLDMVEADQDAVLRLLSMVHRSVTGFEIEMSRVRDRDEEFPIDEWLAQVFSRCPQLHTVVLPSNAELDGLGNIVASAVAGACRLRRLDIDLALDVDSTDVVPFLAVLRDETHPLTKNLEMLKLSVIIEDDSSQNFMQHVRDTLAVNRRLHTFRLAVYASKLDVAVAEPVAIRSAPLDIRSKLAFISATAELQCGNERPGGCLDSSVMGIIFSFAAQHRLRIYEVILND